MDFYKAIYPSHYEGDTLRYAVAYIISPEAKGLPRRLAISLEEQRKRIIHKSVDLECVIVEEFIETDVSHRLVLRPGFLDLDEFAGRYHPSLILHSSEEHLAMNPTDRLEFQHIAVGRWMQIVSADM